MLIIDVMTRNVITAKRDTPVAEAQKIMKEHNFRRLPVVDDEGRPIGIVTADRLERVKPPTTTPLLWQITYLLSRTTVGDVMRKRVVTVKPTDSVEQAIAKAQAAKVGTIIVVEKGKIVGICSTNDFFYGIVNPTLGIGESGSRIIVIGGGEGKQAEKIIGYINKLGIEIKVIWAIFSQIIKKNNLVLHLETEDASNIVEELKKMGYEARVVPR
jgi:acetoin utilization protein AcuB